VLVDEQEDTTVISSGPSGATMTVDIPNTKLGTMEFFIHAVNIWKQEVYSPKQTINILYDCNEDVFAYSTKAPLTDINLWSKSENDVWTLTIEGDVATKLTTTKFDLADRIVYDCGCPVTRCAISEIAIDKVTDAEGKD